MKSMLVPSAQKFIHKGQLTFRNIIVLLIDLLIYFELFLPVYQPMANTAIAAMDPTWQFYSINVVLIYLVPLMMLIGITLTIVEYSTSRYA